jgi:hypothetical protein
VRLRKVLVAVVAFLAVRQFAAAVLMQVEPAGEFETAFLRDGTMQVLSLASVHAVTQLRHRFACACAAAAAAAAGANVQGALPFGQNQVRQGAAAPKAVIRMSYFRKKYFDWVKCISSKLRLGEVAR